MTENDSACVFHLIVEEFSEILHIHLTFPGIYDRGKAIQLCIGKLRLAYSTDDVAKLTDTARLDQNTVRVIGAFYLTERFPEISHKATADTTGIQLVDLNSRLLKKAPVNSDLSELVLDQNKLFPLISLFDQFFNQCGLARTEKSRKNIDLCHTHSSFNILLSSYFTLFFPFCQLVDRKNLQDVDIKIKLHFAMQLYFCSKDISSLTVQNSYPFNKRYGMISRKAGIVVFFPLI